MDQFTQYVLLTTVIVGITEFISRLRGQDYWTALTIGVAAAVGALFGWGHVQGLPDIWTGIAAGFGAAGALTGLSLVGNRTSASESSALRRGK